MVFSQGRGAWGVIWVGLMWTTLLAEQETFAQITCVKPDAGPDVTSNAASIKLKDAPEGYFWSIPSGNPNNTATVHARTGQVTGLTTPGNYKFVLSSIAHNLNLHAPQVLPQDGALQSNTLNGLETLDNGQIKVGVDSRYGGAITYLAAKNGLNMVNNHDRGRQVQIGVYGGPNPFFPPNVEVNFPWRGIGWNPIQAGDSYDNSSKILAFEKRNNLIYVKTLPKHWHLRDYDADAVIEHWIRLVGNVVKVHARVTLSRSDKTQYEARDQEFPCLYLNGNFKRSWKYTGTQPFTNADKELKVAPFDMVNVRVTEPWMALTREDDFGVGLYSPKNFFFKEAFFGTEFSDNEAGASTAYMAATPFAVLDHNSVTDFDYELIVGHINDIRSYIYAQPRPDKGPNYRFTNNRLGWHLVEVNDTGLPITNNLHLLLTGKGSPQLKSPAVAWQGRENPKIYIRAAFDIKGGAQTYQIHWQNREDADFQGLPERMKNFAIINDGQFRTYEIDLRNTTWMNSSIRQIMFRPSVDGPQVTGSFKLEWVSTSPDGPPVAPAETSSVVCTDTLAVNVSLKPMPNAGPDLSLRCGVSSVDLTTPSPSMSWRLLSKPAGSAAVVTTQGAARNLQVPGNYLLMLSDDASKTVDIMSITVPNCSSTQSLSSIVFLDNGSGGGTARNGRQDPGEPGISNVRVTLYSDPNGDGNPADGQLIEQTTTDKRGQYTFTQLYSNEFYVIALNPENFVPGKPLWRTVSSRQANFSSVYGLLSGRILIPGPTPTTAQSRVKMAEADSSFGLIQDCTSPACLVIKIKRL